jgi:hypothetical protein
MSKILGLDLGSNSIGWALIDPDSNGKLSNGIKICSFHSERLQRRNLRRKRERKEYRARMAKLYLRSAKYPPIIVGLFILSGFTFLLSFLNHANWQFWLNMSLTSILTTLTLVHQDKEK